MESQEIKKTLQELSEQADRLRELRKMVRNKRDETEQLFHLVRSSPQEFSEVLQTQEYFDKATWEKIDEERQKVALLLAEHIDNAIDTSSTEPPAQPRPKRKRSPFSKVESHWIFVR